MKTLLPKLIGAALISFPVALNYWAGAVALFAHHPTYWQIYSAFLITTPILLCSRTHSTLSRALQFATVIALLAWIFRLVGIIPNAPF